MKNYITKVFKVLLGSLSFLLPSLAFAQSAPIRDINDVAVKATNIGNLIITLTITLAVIWIIINVVRYLIAGGEEDRKKGGMAILWGVVALFVILSIWGLVAILRNTFNTDNARPTDIIVNPPPPRVN